MIAFESSRTTPRRLEPRWPQREEKQPASIVTATGDAHKKPAENFVLGKSMRDSCSVKKTATRTAQISPCKSSWLNAYWPPRKWEPQDLVSCGIQGSNGHRAHRMNRTPKFLSPSSKAIGTYRWFPISMAMGHPAGGSPEPVDASHRTVEQIALLRGRCGAICFLCRHNKRTLRFTRAFFCL